jgi:hypothetical protein
VKKIGIIGAPGVGKTTLSAGLFYQLKVGGSRVELVPELIKYKIYQGSDFSRPGFDIQNTLEQMNLEESIEKASDHGHSLEFMICEAPLCNGYFYASFYKKEDECPVLKKIAMTKIQTYDLIIFVRKPSDHKYDRIGRKESENTSLKLERHIESELFNICSEIKMIETDQLQTLEKMMEAILNLKDV